MNQQLNLFKRRRSHWEANFIQHQQIYYICCENKFFLKTSNIYWQVSMEVQYLDIFGNLSCFRNKIKTRYNKIKLRFIIGASFSCIYLFLLWEWDLIEKLIASNSSRYIIFAVNININLSKLLIYIAKYRWKYNTLIYLGTCVALEIK